MKLRLRLPTDPNPVVVEIPDDTLMQDVNDAIAEKVGKPSREFEWLAGVPPKRLKDEDMTKPVKACWRNGELLNIQSAAAELKQGHTDGKYVPPIEVRNSVFVRNVMPGDNSCLFHSLGWIFEKKAPEVRQMVSELVKANPAKYRELGMDPQSYAQHILNPNVWGGGIEIDLLAHTFKTEVCVLDMTNTKAKPALFGQNSGYTIRSYIVYTGNHYDAGAVGSSMGGGTLQKIFSSSDERPMLLAQDFLDGKVKEQQKK